MKISKCAAPSTREKPGTKELQDVTGKILKLSKSSILSFLSSCALSPLRLRVYHQRLFFLFSIDLHRHPSNLHIMLLALLSTLICLLQTHIYMILASERRSTGWKDEKQQEEERRGEWVMKMVSRVFIWNRGRVRQNQPGGLFTLICSEITLLISALSTKHICKCGKCKACNYLH